MNTLADYALAALGGTMLLFVLVALVAAALASRSAAASLNQDLAQNDENQLAPVPARKAGEDR
jgi:hypothetical protein